MAIRIGVQLHPQHCTYAEFARATEEAEALGIDTLWTWDHFYPLYGSPGDPFHPAELPAMETPLLGHHFEAYTLLTAMACLTSRVELGALVTCNSYRNPHLLADIARTLDHVSGGRFILGIGSGWFERDYVEYGYPYGTALERLHILGQNLPLIQERLRKLTPPPLRQPLPLMIGGGGEKVTLKLVAQHATLWNGYGTPEEMRHKNQVLDDWCSKVGRDPSEIERTIIINRDFETAFADLQAYKDAGINHFICGVGTPFNLDNVKFLLGWRAGLATA